MLARIRGAIDSQIAAEQAKARASTGSPNNTPGLSRSSSRARASSRNGTLSKNDVGKDPSEFEDSDVATPVIGGTPVGAETPARSGTPVQTETVTEDPLGAMGGEAADDGKEKDTKEKVEDASSGVQKAAVANRLTAASTGSLTSNSELPTEVRVKLRKLEKMEAKYTELLRSYKIVHARNALIEPFEKALRENTPCESISDPKVLLDYINSFSQRSDMVKNELVRVSKEKDEYKASAQKARDELETKDKEIAELKKARGEVEVQKGTTKKDKSDDIFNFDEEHEELGSKVEELENANKSLTSELETTRQARKVAEEAVASMQRSVEDAQSELEGLRETGAAKDLEICSLRKKLEESVKEVESLTGKVGILSGEVDKALKATTKATEDSVADAAAKSKKLDELNKALEEKTKRLDAEMKTAEQLRKTVKGQLEQLLKFQNEARMLADTKSKLDVSTQELDKLKSIKTDLERAVAKLEGQLQGQKKAPNGASAQPPNPAEAKLTENTSSVTGGSGKKKKKGKKKGKGGSATPAASTSVDDRPVKESETVEEESEQDISSTPAYTSESIITDLQSQLETLKQGLNDKNARISALTSNHVDVESLKEEVESLRDDLINVGQDHVEARQKLKEQSKELMEIAMRKRELEATVERLEAEVSELKKSHSSASAESDEAYQTLESEFAKLKQSSSGLQVDLAAAQQLAAARFKDLTEMRNMIAKVQPELTSLRSENATLISTKNDLNKQLVDLKRLERTERDLKNDLQVLNKKMTDKDSEISSLRKKNAEETSRRLKVEEETGLVKKDLRKAEVDYKSVLDNAEQIKTDFARVQDEISVLKSKITSLEKQLKEACVQRDDLKEELELKVAQLESTQSLMNSMRDQTSELTVQTREAQEQRESTEEELAEAQRLLTERTREAETMRRMLSEVETRHEARTREMKERIDTACDERDKAEEEVATIGRRRAREIEELKDKLRDAERGLRRAEEARELTEKELGGLKNSKARMEEILERERRELGDTKKAMSSMTSALDDTDGQVREIERQKTELRRRAEQAESKYEKLQKQHRTLQDEVRSIQTMRAKAIDAEGRPGSRSSMDSARSSRPMSPKPRTPSVGVDLVYLKNVLLQFMELKDKNQQKQLVPALKMLLDLDSKEERKWLQVVQAR
ncbi:hypothetical protein BDD12DRAFT_794770 [Trichophaea hybrida]|nr:hypothetical protein BDD12DRAFT_794770 [Trichophaea hybrida]